MPEHLSLHQNQPDQPQRELGSPITDAIVVDMLRERLLRRPDHPDGNYIINDEGTCSVASRDENGNVIFENGKIVLETVPIPTNLPRKE